MKPALLILILGVFFFSSCTKKKPDDSVIEQKTSTYQPTSVIPLDTSGAYISPTDLFRDNSQFDRSSFFSKQIKYFGNRTVSYSITSRSLKNQRDTITLVLEYLGGKIEYAGSGEGKVVDDARTMTRLLFYLNNTLSFRKAFPVEVYDGAYFPVVRSFDKTFFDASPTKTIVYFWTDETGYGNNYEKESRREYQAVGVDKDGIIYDLVGYFHHVSDNLDAVRFLREDRVSASVVPDQRYRNVALDVIITVDWKTSTTSLEVPRDTIFPVTNTPDRFFGSKTTMFNQPTGMSVFKELSLRRATRAQMVRMFAPSLLSSENIVRDRLFIHFNNTNKGWIDNKTMISEEIVAER
ncbi:MAG: hypothetical protein HYV29_09875 [Ignavibacteriales bacterium]|nr:hypothetical protein [Ignavibacteriales bacterium]